MKDSKVYLGHILDAIYRIEVWVQDSTFEDFLDDSGLLQSSVIRQLEIIGEASSRVRKEFMKTHPEIPWSSIVDMRNRLIHEYMTVDLDLTWDVIKSELPVLKAQIEEILRRSRC